jgi:thioredoxin 1
MYKLLLLFICCVALSGCLHNNETTSSLTHAPAPEVIVLEKTLDGESAQDKFTELIKDGNVVVDFFATWCGPCKMMHPIIDQLAQKYKDTVRFVKIDVDQFTELTRNFKVGDQIINVEGYPQFFFFKDGSLINHVGGASSLETFETTIKSMFNL